MGGTSEINDIHSVVPTEYGILNKYRFQQGSETVLVNSSTPFPMRITDK